VSINKSLCRYPLRDTRKNGSRCIRIYSALGEIEKNIISLCRIILYRKGARGL
jgi:ribosomal protein S14